MANRLIRKVSVGIEKYFLQRDYIDTESLTIEEIKLFMRTEYVDCDMSTVVRNDPNLVCPNRYLFNNISYPNTLRLANRLI